MSGLKKGFDYEKKLKFLEKKTIAKGSKNNYISSLNIITELEDLKGTSIFTFDRDMLINSISQISPDSIRLTSSVITEYFDYYRKYEDNSVSNLACKLFKDSTVIKLAYNKHVNKFISSLDELLMLFSKVHINKRNRLIAVLLYMGMDPDKITKLKVENIDFSKRELKCGESVYLKIDQRILNIIKDNIHNEDDTTELLLKNEKNNSFIKPGSVRSAMCTFNNDITNLGLNKSLLTKTLRDAGMLGYYCGHKDEFTKTDNAAQYIMLYKLFGNMKKVSASRFSVCNDDFRKSMEVFQQNVVDSNSYFTAYTKVTEDELKIVKENSGVSAKKIESCNKNLLENNRVSYGEEARNGEENDTEDNTWYKNQEKKGKENELLIKDKLSKYNNISDIEFMKDFSGYDIRFKLNGEFHRFEVKTVNNSLEFHITLNEINGIYDDGKINYAIILVKDGRIKVIDDVYGLFGGNKEFIFRLYENKESMQMIANNFIIRLEKSFYNSLKTLRGYIRELNTK